MSENNVELDKPRHRDWSSHEGGSVYQRLHDCLLKVVNSLQLIVATSPSEATDEDHVSSHEVVVDGHELVRNEIYGDESLIVIDDNDVFNGHFRQLTPILDTAQPQYGTSLNPSKGTKYLELGAKYVPESNPFKLDAVTNNYRTVTSELNLPSNDDYRETVIRHYFPEKPISGLNFSVLDSLISNFPSEGYSDILKKEQEAKHALISKSKAADIAVINPLSPDQLRQVQNAWNTNLSVQLVSNFLIDISPRDLATLKNGHWLNDNIIDYYLNLISMVNPKIHSWTTHFFTTLESKGYQGVARWAKRRKLNLVEKLKVLIPINIMGTHWALAVIDNKEMSIKYYDSLNSNGNIRAVTLIKDYMREEAKRLNSSVDYSSYHISSNEKTPQQKNGSDCGVFTCAAARFISEGKPLMYTQSDMKNIRYRMAFEILNSELLR